MQADAGHSALAWEIGMNKMSFSAALSHSQLFQPNPEGEHKFIV